MSFKQPNKNTKTTKADGAKEVKNISTPFLSVLILDTFNKKTSTPIHKSTEISNLLNLSSTDFEKLQKGHRELTLKELHLLCLHYKVDIDSLYEEMILKQNNIKF
jgi:hypothetical protein